jgi:hypothetical protein
MKTKLITFFDVKGLDHFNLFHKAKESTKLTVWKYWLCEAVPKEISDVWLEDSILNYENKTAHKSLSVKKFLTQESILLRMTPGCF